MLADSSTGMPVVDAREDFLRARRAHLAARLVRRARVPRGAARLEVIPLKAVVGDSVVDGRHRVSVALALGRPDIETPVRTVSSFESAEAA